VTTGEVAPGRPSPRSKQPGKVPKPSSAIRRVPSMQSLNSPRELNYFASNRPDWNSRVVAQALYFSDAILALQLFLQLATRSCAHPRAAIPIPHRIGRSPPSTAADLPVRRLLSGVQRPGRCARGAAPEWKFGGVARTCSLAVVDAAPTLLASTPVVGGATAVTSDAPLTRPAGP
jgi:hypothetical protein